MIIYYFITVNRIKKQKTNSCAGARVFTCARESYWLVLWKLRPAPLRSVSSDWLLSLSVPVSPVLSPPPPQSVSQWAALLRLSAPSWAHLTAGGFLSPPRSGPLQGADTQVRNIHLIRVKVLQVVSVKWRGLFWGHKKSQPALCHCSASEVSESLSRSVSRLLTRVLKFWKFHDVKLHTGNIYLHMYFKN